MILKIINEMGKRKLDTKSTIWASSLKGMVGADAAAAAGGFGCTICTTCGVDGCVVAMEAADSTCSELVLCSLRRMLFEFTEPWCCSSESKWSWLWLSGSMSFRLYTFRLASRLPIMSTFSLLLFAFWDIFCTICSFRFSFLF